MANEPSKESSVTPDSDSDGEREDSGLMDILSVASGMKKGGGSDEEVDDSGVILFTSGDDDDAGKSSDADDDALFGSFAGGLGAGGFGADEPEPSGGLSSGLSSGLSDGPSLLDQVSAESGSKPEVTAAPATATAAPPSDGESRKPLIIVAAVLGLALVGGGIFMMNKSKGEDQQAKAEVVADAAVGKAEEPEPEVVPEPEPEPAPVPVPEPEVADTEGDTEGFDTEGCDPSDPMCAQEGVLDSDGSASKGGKWDRGKSYHKDGGEAAPAPKVEDDPLPLTGGGGGGKVSEEDVDCLLNPDLPKCAGGGSGPAPKEKQVLKPKIPEKLTQAELRKAMGSVKGSAKKCGLKHGFPPGTKVEVHVSVESKGTVSEVTSKGEHAGSALGKCVEAAAKKAIFPEFKTQQMGFDFPFVM